MKTIGRVTAAFLILVMLFTSCAQAEKVLKLPTGLKVIEEEAFLGDTSVGKVVLPSGVQEIHSRAFANSSLTEINLPDSLEFIDDTAFSGVGNVRVTVSHAVDIYAYQWAVENGYIAANPESTHPYDNGVDLEWIYTYPTSALYLQVTFSDDTEFENGYDKLTVVDADGSETEYSGTALAGETLLLPGSSFTLRLHTDGSVTRYGFRITNIEALNTIPVTGVTVTPDFFSLRVGETQTLTATVMPDNATDKSVVWSSSDPSVARVSNTGVVTAVSNGTATITAASKTDSSKFGTSTVEVNPYPQSAHPYDNDLDQEWTYTHPESAAALRVTFSDNTQFENRYDTLTITDAQGNQTVYTGSELAGQTVVVMGNSFTLLLHTDNSYSYYGFRITSIEALSTVPVTGVTVTPALFWLRVGETKTLTATVSPESAPDKSVVWSSSDPSVARVSNTGVVTAVSNGTATITAASKADSSKFGTSTVEVSPYPQSDHPYGNDLDQEWTYTHPTSAAALNVTFSDDTEFESGYDTLTITDIDGSTTVYTGTELAGQTLLVPGNSFSLLLRSDYSNTKYGFRITNIEALSSVPVMGVTVSPAFLTLRVGEAQTLTATVRPSTAANKNIVWSSSAPSVATVSSTGKVTAVSNGSATITAASAEDSSISATCTVNVGNSAYRALVIGNNDYSGDSALHGCVNDMNAMKGMLTGLTNTFQVTTLPNATASEILSAIPTAFAGATDSDVSLIFYSGHGLSSNNSSRMGAWMGIDDRPVTFSELAAALDKIPGQIIVIMDSCHSGAAISDKGAKELDDELEAYIHSLVNAVAGHTIGGGNEKSSELAKPKYIVMAAAMYSESSYDGRPDGTNYGGHFAYNLIRGIGCTYPNGAYSGSMPADTNNDKLITLLEAFKYAYDNALNSVSQHAVYYGDGSTVLFRRK